MSKQNNIMNLMNVSSKKIIIIKKHKSIRYDYRFSINIGYDKPTE